MVLGQPSPHITLIKVTFYLFISKIQPFFHKRIVNLSRGAIFGLPSQNNSCHKMSRVNLGTSSNQRLGVCSAAPVIIVVCCWNHYLYVNG